MGFNAVLFFEVLDAIVVLAAIAGIARGADLRAWRQGRAAI